MYDRNAITELKLLLSEFPAVAILGPRQVGKTSLALQLAEALTASAAEQADARASDRRQPALYLDLENPLDAAKLSDPMALFQANRDRLVILDEVQREPQLFATLRGIIDERRRAKATVGQFLLLGSASGALLRQSAESLAGRMAYLQLSTLLLDEVGFAQLPELWLRGGFPESLDARSDAASLRWRQQFITTYLERDIPQLALTRIPAELLRRFWTMLAHDQGQMLNAARLASNLGVSGQTIGRYLDLLCDLMLVRRLQPWSGNLGKRLVRAPKVYVRDCGLVHALLNIKTTNDLLSHPTHGASFEGMVIEQLIAAAPHGTESNFYRTAAGAELDLLLTLPGGERWAIEIKRSSAPTVSKGFHIAAQDVCASQRIVTSPATDAWPMTHGAKHVPLGELVRSLKALD